MAKTVIVNADDNTRVPFLRGILTRSLQNVGVPFDDAYEIASTIRHEIDDIPEMSSADLRVRILEHLRISPHIEAASRYQSKSRAPAPIIVEDARGQRVPFSRYRMQQRLESCGIDSENTAAIIRAIYDQLLKEDKTLVTAAHLGMLTYQYIARDAGDDAAQRYLVWADFARSGRPLLLLINGTAASGKSTVSTEVASRLEIVRTQSTDMLRQVMRMLIPDRLVPVLHASSFEAWRSLPGQHGEEHPRSPRLLVTGFNRQAELLEIACEAVLERAIQERVSLILEGVHIRPSLIDKIPAEADAEVVPVTLAVLKRESLLRHMQGRGTETPQRRSERYLANFDSIWRIQSYILSEADKSRIPIVVNEDKETAVNEVIRIVGDKLSQHFSRTAEEVFAPAPGAVVPDSSPDTVRARGRKPAQPWWRRLRPGTN